MGHFTRDGTLVLAGLLLGACGGSEDSRESEVGAARSDSSELAASVAPQGLRVASVMIGKRVGKGNLVTEPTFQFAPQDTVHVSVGTEGRGAGQVTAAWRSQSGQILQKSSEFTRAAGENTAFSLSQAKGLKPGTYKVVVFLDGDSAETKVFVVKK